VSDNALNIEKTIDLKLAVPVRNKEHSRKKMTKRQRPFADPSSVAKPEDGLSAFNRLYIFSMV